VEKTPIADARIPVVLNVTARPSTSAEEIKEEMVMQLTSSVQWIESVRWMVS